MARKAQISAPSSPVVNPPPPSSAPQFAIKSVKTGDYHTIYSNFSKIGISQWDLSVIFGQIIESSESENVAEETICIKFSPQYFKVLAESLNTAISQWESLFGVIPLGLGQGGNAPGMAKAFDTLKGVLVAIEKQTKANS